VTAIPLLVAFGLAGNLRRRYPTTYTQD
jgi:hypothetical protein